MATQPTIGFVMHDVARLMRKRFEQRARHTSLTRSQWHVLAMLAMNEGLHQKALADLMDIESITLVRLLDKMEANGLVERRKHPTDRRMSLLFLTDAAHPLLDVMRGLAATTRVEATAGFSEAEREQLLQLLSRMRANLLDACALPVEIPVTDEEEQAHV